MSTTNAPSARSFPTAVWTGSEMIVWGGYADSIGYVNTGARYNPSTDTWTAISTTNAPSARYAQTAVWTGSEMIVWGGSSEAIALNTGGRYNPTTDRWTPISTTNAPAARITHSAVWTGSAMIVWGGTINFVPTNTGSRYNPVTDTWTATNVTSAAAPRFGHSAVWTGTEMIVWGGRGLFGGRYNPTTDSWIITCDANEPAARDGAAVVWTGSDMIIWGGFGNQTFLNTGGIYSPRPNPIDDAHNFVHQHYLDFLNREPDQGGWDYWTSIITQCGNDDLCIHNKRVDVSNAFFYEQEYQQTGSYVYRIYRAAFGNNQPFSNPDNSNQTEAKKLPSNAAFAPDRAQVVGGANLAQSQLDFANAFVQRPEFLSKYPANLDGSAFVDAVLIAIQNDLGANLVSQRAALIDLYNSGGRGAVIYRLGDDNVQTNPINNRALIDAEYNRAFVFTQYAGYLRRDADIGGFLFWLGQVNNGPLRDATKQHAMVCSFITSAEYQLRFGSVATHSNSECR